MIVYSLYGSSTLMGPTLRVTPQEARARRAAEQISRMGYPHVRYLQETYQALMPGATGPDGSK